MWIPNDEWIEKSNLYRQMKKLGMRDYEEFLQRSFYDYEWFWSSFFEEVSFVWFEKYSKVLDTSEGKPWPKWFVDGKLNWTYSALDKNPPDKVALIWEGEDGEVRIYTYGKLLEEVNKLSNVLKDLGIEKKDSVGIFLPFIPETAISLLAISRIGAIAVPLFSGFGPSPIIARLRDAEAKTVITADFSMRKGEKINMLGVLRETYSEIPTLRKVIVLRRYKTELWGIEEDYYDLLGKASAGFDVPSLDPEHPFMIIYTSGTTGKPKGALHVHGGFMIKAAQDMFHLFDIKESDVITWMTDIGWMMGPWLIGGALINSSTLFMFEGIPNYPKPSRLWEMVERHGITILGITPTLIRSIMADESVKNYSLENLRMVGSTGEPWDPKSWLWTFENVLKGKKPIINYSGGTEISGGILGCVVIKPIKPTSFNTPVPGVHAVALNDEGKEVVGEVALLGVKNLNPGMTRGFWKDKERYLETYWSKWEGVWYHGDLVLVDNEGFWYILGRADDTIKVAGKRIGPSEIEALANKHPNVLESAAIGIPDEVKGQSIVLFVVLKEEVEDREKVRREIGEMFVKEMGKAFVPKDVIFVSSLPKTRNAKIMRRLIRNAYLGEPLGDTSALLNPEALEEIKWYSQKR